ncbi:hypothetical protein P9E76_08580 [Schinkia azotoformans]|uniref:Uncharacterized protein n=1 Tax=Schinkia azotoformans LMG 9581 TaxID=1131731 RepID=K6D4B0_SCHAZ|nr:hypothetical protein [Schinkia azotoformans]EKN62893.1 hypothetical protein BAZO_20048 [Schinkia azotoformans LMG 9581]MEC1641058.1 hypothetical protein [Schinkia azotoformans]MEC1945100.1 hypothetical protein [Schinkia azotoformans]
MVFANESMTQEEIACFEVKAIKNPGNRLSTLRPSIWTIDRENNVFLVWGLQEREEPHDYYFLLSWKDTPIPVKLGESWVTGSPRIWELRYIKIPVNLKEKRDEIIQSLKDALKVYAFNGVPDWPHNKTTKVQFRF